jgi:uncharacterized membrane protein YeaQ/YmgE (transglycosylase-associated protein family)
VPGCFSHVRFLCGDIRMTVYTLVVVCAGAVHGVIDSFLMYRMDEMGCLSETPMGVMMLLRFGIEALLLWRQDKLMHKYGNRHAMFVSLGLSLLGAQVKSVIRRTMNE